VRRDIAIGDNKLQIYVLNLYISALTARSHLAVYKRWSKKIIYEYI